MKNKQKPRSSRTFSVEFKKLIVNDYLKGEFTVGQLCKLHKLHAANVYRWIYKYGGIPKPKTLIVEMENSSSEKLKQYEARIKELERCLGSKQLQLDYYIKLIEVASDHYGDDIKKNLDIMPLNR